MHAHQQPAAIFKYIVIPIVSLPLFILVIVGINFLYEHREAQLQSASLTYGIPCEWGEVSIYTSDDVNDSVAGLLLHTYRNIPSHIQHRKLAGGVFPGDADGLAMCGAQAYALWLTERR